MESLGIAFGVPTEHGTSANHQFRSEIDLRGFTYDRIYVEWGPMLSKLFPFDRQPYSQLENAIRLTGDEQAANDVYFARRAREFRDRIRWHGLSDTILGVIVDIFYRLTAGYGVRPMRLIVTIFAVLILGTIAFSQSGAVELEKREEGHNQPPIDLEWIKALQVSFDQLVPISLPGADQWSPSQGVWREVIGVTITFAGIATALALLGWLLIPVIVAMITSKFRRQI